ncbi:hypothetical protein C0991_007269 [Blastosporella zonata]|nr:hypothetical protein C0991_007269 [Blastosporella zonata]
MSSLAPVLPYDVLRLIFEQAALDDRREALKLVFLSRQIQRWIELILYSVVTLHRETTCRAFLRTIETSRTKSRAFFATHVKSLCISYDIYNDRTVRIITACPGVTSLTFWAIPTPWQTSIIRISHEEISAALDPLRPRKLSVLLHGVLGAPYPRFNLSFFQNITHLSVINKWEDWTTWWGFDALRCLTHLSFDLRVGPRSLDDKAAYTIAQSLQAVLSSCIHMHVCVLLLLFDPSPKFTAAKITHYMPVSQVDTRLVLMGDSEPFLDREAHSNREARIWRMAEEAVNIQASEGVMTYHERVEVLFTSDVRNMGDWANRTHIPLTSAQVMGLTYRRAHRWFNAIRLQLIRDYKWTNVPCNDDRMLFTLERRSSAGLPAGPKLGLQLPINISTFFSPERRVQWEMVFHSDTFESVRKICPPINDILNLIQCLLTGVVTLIFEENLPQGMHRTTRGLPSASWVKENKNALVDVFGTVRYGLLLQACHDTKLAFKLEVFPH